MPVEQDGQRFEPVPVQDSDLTKNKAETDDQDERRGPQPLLEQPARLGRQSCPAPLDDPIIGRKRVGLRRTCPTGMTGRTDFGHCARVGHETSTAMGRSRGRGSGESTRRATDWLPRSRVGTPMRDTPRPRGFPAAAWPQPTRSVEAGVPTRSGNENQYTSFPGIVADVGNDGARKASRARAGSKRNPACPVVIVSCCSVGSRGPWRRTAGGRSIGIAADHFAPGPRDQCLEHGWVDRLLQESSCPIREHDVKPFRPKTTQLG